MLKNVSIILFSSLLALAAPVSHINKASHKISKKSIKKQTFKEYTVQKGDTLFSIARKFKANISDIVKLNKITNNLIHPGDKIKVPTISYEEKAKEAVAQNKKTVYTIKKGDTLTSIAKKFNMKIEDIRKLNKFKKGKILRVGTEINVYAPKKVIKKRKKVTKVIVRKGDTLWRIAKKYNLTLKEIRILNPKVRRYGLQKGMILNVSKEKAQKLLKLAKKKKRNLRGRLSQYTNLSTTGNNSRVVRYAKRFLGTPYVWGASSGRAFDCSGFTQYVMKHAKGKIIPRVSRRQAYYGMYVPRSRLIPADLVFFDTSRRRRGYVNHVGIYIGNNYFIHASSARHRVVITSLNKPFYRSRFMWGRRIN